MTTKTLADQIRARSARTLRSTAKTAPMSVPLIVWSHMRRTNPGPGTSTKTTKVVYAAMASATATTAVHQLTYGKHSRPAPDDLVPSWAAQEKYPLRVFVHTNPPKPSVCRTPQGYAVAFSTDQLQAAQGDPAATEQLHSDYNAALAEALEHSAAVMLPYLATVISGDILVRKMVYGTRNAVTPTRAITYITLDTARSLLTHLARVYAMQRLVAAGKVL